MLTTYPQSAVRTLAKQLVTLRKQKDQLYGARAKIAGVGNVASAAATQASLAGVMGNVAGVMSKVNDSVSAEETAKIMQQFAVENEKMNMSEEMMDDALIDAVRNLERCERCTGRSKVQNVHAFLVIFEY